MAMDIFLKITDVKGEARDKTHKEEIDVLAWSWGTSNSGNAHVGGGMGAGKVNVQDLSITKYVDSATADLHMSCMNGKHFKEAKLVVRKAGEKPLEYLKIDMTDVLVTSISSGGSGGEDRLTENVSLNFAKVKVEYFSQDNTGVGKPAGSVTFNIAENAKE